jgi:hypothetical protein
VLARKEGKFLFTCKLKIVGVEGKNHEQSNGLAMINAGESLQPTLNVPHTPSTLRIILIQLRHFSFSRFFAHQPSGRSFSLVVRKII